MERAFVDSNVVLRFLTGEPPEMAQQAHTLFAAVDRGQIRLVLEEVVVAEIVWVLQSFYGHKPADISRTLLQLIAHEGIECRGKARLAEALTLYADRRIDLTDALLAASVYASGERTVYSFDRHFDRLEGITRRVPGETAGPLPAADPGVE
jgi:predicted nucleic acid-binding protein